MLIVIPLPPVGNRSQAQGNWRSKSQAVKAYRAEVKAYALEHRGVKFTRKVVVHHHWFLGKTPLEKQLGAKCPKVHKKYRPRDEQNAIYALKPAIDALVDAGILKDDAREFVTWGRYEWAATEKEHKGRAFVHLTLEEVEE